MVRPFYQLDWCSGIGKEYRKMLRRLIVAATILILLAVDWLTFHDLLEPHSVRDYLTLAASLLVFSYLGLDVLLGDKPTAPRAG